MYETHLDWNSDTAYPSLLTHPQAPMLPLRNSNLQPSRFAFCHHCLCPGSHHWILSPNHLLTSATPSIASRSFFNTSKNLGLKNFVNAMCTGERKECNVPRVRRSKRWGFAWCHCTGQEGMTDKRGCKLETQFV